MISGEILRRHVRRQQRLESEFMKKVKDYREEVLALADYRIATTDEDAERLKTRMGRPSVPVHHVRLGAEMLRRDDLFLD